ncbi:MAG: hypothetical protein H6710_10995 [Myxococcales bacterium]|nr:hypothetical protein [Myxococcales bacterium]
MGARSRRKKGRRNTRINAAIADPDDSFAGAAALDRATIDEGSPEESGSLGEVPSSFADGPADGPPPDDELRAKPRTEPRDTGAGEGGEHRAPPPLPTRSSVAPTLHEPPKPSARARPAASDDVTLVGPPPPPPPPKRSTLGDFPTSFAPGLDDERDALAQTLVDDEPRTRAGSARRRGRCGSTRRRAALLGRRPARGDPRTRRRPRPRRDPGGALLRGPRRHRAGERRARRDPRPRVELGGDHEQRPGGHPRVGARPRADPRR